MPKCEICNQVFTTKKPADSCIPTQFIKNGKIYPRQPYDGSWSPEGETRCPDCACQTGGFHHCGCDVERCPVCGGQLMGCECVSETQEEVVR